MIKMQLSPLEHARKELLDTLECSPDKYSKLWAKGDDCGTYTVYGYYRDSWLKEWCNDVIGTKLTREDILELGVSEKLIQ